MIKNTRACHTCGQEKPKKDLLRMTRSPDGDLVVDWRRNLGGRGVHVCPAKRCIESVAPEQFRRLLTEIKESYLRKVSTLVASSVSRRALSPGTDEATSAVKSNRAHLLILARDYSKKEDLEALSNKANIPSRIIDSKELIGKLSNRPPTGALAICNSSLAEALTKAIDTYSALV